MNRRLALTQTTRPAGSVAARPRVPTAAAAARHTPAAFQAAWQNTDKVLQSVQHPSLTNILQDSFESHTATMLGNFADARVQDAAGLVADACISVIPVVNSLPHVRALSVTLAKQMASRLPTKTLVKDALKKCGTDHAARLLALSLSSFLAKQAHAWGSTKGVDAVAGVLNSHPAIITAFLRGTDVDVSPVVRDLVPRQTSADAIFKLIRSKALCAWCRHHCGQQQQR